uniref:VOC domain-containing protein n=1 Tax=Parascaris univalens TaxID=6257 RepID=A0A915C4V8_PARUN
CVLDCAPQALNYLYNGEFMPFVVVIAPPELDELRQINLLRSNRRSEEQIKATIEENKKLLSSDYARMFHLIITNRNADVTFKRLMDALNDLKNEIQWVPESGFVEFICDSTHLITLLRA